MTSSGFGGASAGRVDGVAEVDEGGKWASPRPLRAALGIGTSGFSYVMAFGILLPIVTLIIELASGMSAEIYVDPIPSNLHIALVAFVPLANMLVMAGVSRGWVRGRRLLGVVSGAGITIATIYGIVYLPISPFAAVGILFVGIGFLALSPILAFFAALVSCGWLRGLRPADGKGGIPGLVTGLFAGLLMFIAAEGPALATRMGLNMMRSNSAAERLRGVQFIRNFGSERQLLYACYGLPGGMSGTISRDRRQLAWPEDARRAYYQVTGRAFNSEDIPFLARRRGWSADPALDFFFDEALGSDQVAGRVPGLSLASSRMDGLVEADAAVGYVEWTMVFANRSALEREARAVVQLPVGGVVSRLTLWINGEEHEAAFGGSAQVQAAYREVVVVQRRDPVLVSYAGPDRVMVQCFPVPVNGRMKIRVGVTCPLQVDASSPATGRLRLPAILERNFDVDEDADHAVWLEGDRAMRGSGGALRGELSADGKHVLRGTLGDKVDGAGALVSAERKDVMAAWTQRKPGKGAASVAGVEPEPGEREMAVVQTFNRVEAPRPSRMAVVVDGSVSLADHAEAIAEALNRVPVGMEFALIIASDRPQWVSRLSKSTPALIEQVSEEVEDFDFEGGRDNTEALEEAWDEAAGGGKEAVVLWLHGPQPVVLRDAEPLLQRMQRQKDGPTIHALAVESGQNHIVKSLAHHRRFHTLGTTGDAGEQVGQLLSDWSSASTHLVATRSVLPMETVASITNGQQAVHASQHLRRLWANDAIQRLLESDDVASRQQAVDLGKANQLVTPITGAVVLETQVQYQRHGLQQGSASNSPSVPEPSTALLFAVTVGVLAKRRRRDR